MIKQDLMLFLTADNNFSVLNRIINILNRRRVRIRTLEAYENPEDYHKGRVVMLIHTTTEMAEKVKLQLEKLIEVEEVSYHVNAFHENQTTEPVILTQ